MENEKNLDNCKICLHAYVCKDYLGLASRADALVNDVAYTAGDKPPGNKETSDHIEARKAIETIIGKYLFKHCAQRLM